MSELKAPEIAQVLAIKATGEANDYRFFDLRTGVEQTPERLGAILAHHLCLQINFCSPPLEEQPT